MLLPGSKHRKCDRLNCCDSITTICLPKSANGQILWDSAGIPVSKAYSGQFGYKVIGDGSGGAIISWIDGRAVPAKIYAQHVSAEGKAQ